MAGQYGVQILNDWNEKLQFSNKYIPQDIEMIKNYFGAVDVEKTDLELDKAGIDYIAYLKDGAEINVDVKRRNHPERYWTHNEPELVLEMFSVREQGKEGWTLSNASNVDYILYAFDGYPSYMIPFQQLKRVFQLNGRKWMDEYRPKEQINNGWTSEAIFVPASVVLKAIQELSEIRS